MKRLMAGAALVGSILMARAGYAQEDEGEKIKKQILAEVEKRLKAEEDRILKEISKIVDEELAKWKKGEKPSSHEPKHEPKKEEPKKKAPGYLGIYMDGEGDQPAEGVLVRDVVPDSPAAAAGLKKGDVIVKVDEKETPDFEALRSYLGDKGEGTPVKVVFLRENKEQSVIVTLAARPPAPDEVEPEDKDPKKDEPGKGDLRERVKKFLDRKGEAPKPKGAEKKNEPPAEDDDFLALDDTMMEQVRPMLEQFGMNPDDYFEKGDDGKWRPGEQLRGLFKQFDFKRFFGKPNEEEPEEETPKKVEKPKVEKPKVESAKPAWIGIVPAELSDEDRAEFDLEGGVGLAITEVMEGSPAAKCGVQKGDVLVRINDKKVKGEEALQKFVASAKPGQECDLLLIRKGKETKVKLTLAERKD